MKIRAFLDNSFVRERDEEKHWGKNDFYAASLRSQAMEPRGDSFHADVRT